MSRLNAVRARHAVLVLLSVFILATLASTPADALWTHEALAASAYLVQLLAPGLESTERAIIAD